MQYIACIRLYPFVTSLAACRHLEGAVNLQFYSVLLHSISGADSCRLSAKR